MSLFNFLELQPVEPDNESSSLDYFERDEIRLEEDIDAEQLGQFLGEAVEDMHQDPAWQPYSDDE